MNQFFKIILPVAACLSLACGNLQGQSQKSWQWVSSQGGKFNDISGGITSDSKDNIYVAGSYTDTLIHGDRKYFSSGHQDIFVSRYSSKGKPEETLIVGGTGEDQATIIKTTINNNIIIGGRISKGAVFGQHELQNEIEQLFLSRMNDKGRFDWVVTLTPSSSASLFLAGTDHQGNVYAAGFFRGTLASEDEKIKSAGKKDIFLLKADPSGKIKNLVALGGEGHDMPSAFYVSNSGTIFLSGITSNGFQFKTSEIEASRQNPNTEVFSDAFLMALDAELNPLWSHGIKGSEYCEITSLADDSNGGFYAAGSFNQLIRAGDLELSSNGYSDGFIIRYGKDGKIAWLRSFGSSYYDYINGITADQMGGVILTGSLGDTMQIDNIAVYPISENNSALAIQFSSEGEAIWADCISGAGRNFSKAITLDHEGNLYLTGTFSETFSKVNIDMTSTGGQDVFVAKYYNCPRLENTILGNTTLCPGSKVQLSLKPGFSNAVWNSSITGSNYIDVDKPGMVRVQMMDKRGCLHCDSIEVIEAAPSTFWLGEDLLLSVDESWLIKAPPSFTGYQWHDGSTGDSFLAMSKDKLPGVGLYSLSAIDSLGCCVDDTLKIEFFKPGALENTTGLNLQLFPNPVEHELTWSIDRDNASGYVIEVSDGNGRMLHLEKVGDYRSGTLMTVNFTDIPSGAYYFRIKYPDGTLIKSRPVIRK